MKCIFTCDDELQLLERENAKLFCLTTAEPISLHGFLIAHFHARRFGVIRTDFSNEKLTRVQKKLRVNRLQH
jgi:hypothetical protein